jgi:hypothetical protein
VASCLPAQKLSGWLPSVGWQLGSPCRWLPVSSCTRSPVGTAHWPDTKYLHMHAVESMRRVMRLGHRCESRAAKYNDPGILDMRDFSRWRKIKKAQQQPNLQPDELLFSPSSSAAPRTVCVLESPSLLLTNRHLQSRLGSYLVFAR